MAEMIQAQKDCHTAQRAVRNDSTNNISRLFKYSERRNDKMNWIAGSSPAMTTKNKLSFFRAVQKC